MSVIADDFIRAASVALDGSWHSTGMLEHAREILAREPSVASESIYTAAVLGNDSAVRQFIQTDPPNATRKGGPYGWDALTYLCFSKYLRIDAGRSAGFVSAATMLIDAGADPNTGFYSDEHLPEPVWESVLYGAAGVAHNDGMTQLLIDRGADPNDGETEYHAPEWFNNRPMEIIVESGKLAPMGLTTMLHRKLDWTNYAGVRWLLNHGADPNMVSMWGSRALDHSIGRDNKVEFIELLLDFGANPLLATTDGMNAFTRAAASGRVDIIERFRKRGFTYEMNGAFALLEACARGNVGAARELSDADPEMIPEIRSMYPGLLANFAGSGNTNGVRALLDLGFDIESRSTHPGWNGMSALHLAIWRDRLDTVKLLVDRGASLASADGEDAVGVARRAQVEESEWTPHETSRILDYLAGISEPARG
jgi:ankyrin repeat protein